MTNNLGRILVALVPWMFGLGAMALSSLVVSEAATAQSAWKAEWDKTVAAAKKEGMLLVGATGHPRLRSMLTNMWSKEFPEIKIVMTNARARGWVTRVNAERKAGKYLWDVFNASGRPDVYKAAPEIFDDLRPALILPDVKDPKTWDGFDDAFFDKDGTRVFAFLKYLSTLWYNAKLVPPKRVEELGLKVLLDPAYKGKIAWHDPRVPGSGVNFATLIEQVLGRDGLKKVIVDQESVFYRGSSAVTEAMVREQMVITIGTNLSMRLDQYRKAGMKFDMRPFGNKADNSYASAGATMIAIMNRAPHPNAAKVFVNWILSKPLQAAIAKTYRWNSRRHDVAKGTPPEMVALPGEKYFAFQKESLIGMQSQIVKYLRGLRPL